MKQLTLRSSALVFALGGILFLGACHKKQPPPPPPPPPAPAAPTASLSASPETIDKGQSTTLTWQTSNATDVGIDGIGAVQPSGTQQVTPAESTTYTLTAKGAGGTQSATARVTVNAPPPPPPPAPTSSMTEEQMFAQNVKDIYFDYDKSDVRGDQQASIQADAAFLQQHPNMSFTIEGHCDERGSTEYNLALGDSRASSVKNALVSAGVSADRIKTTSLGKERPFCTESNEACWQQNRRGHFVYSK
ncbi:MAG TPA: peptidoglycan-associated lipoprotein Pal [Terriglobales bacterium]|jgi:peptidoglycan-associated lipoprotein|nr:peptidoglycan-associated lipoprotein Pal [Terriglobales bacterium]